MTHRAAALLVALVLTPSGPPTEARMAGPAGLGAGVWGGFASLAVVAEHGYRMNGKIRPLLFWIGRADVGGARLVWRGRDGEVSAVEFLIGTDPARAPRRLNRWGYIAEAVRGREAELLGVMKESGEQTLADATARLDATSQGGLVVFKAIRSTIAGNEATARVATIGVPGDPTYRDAAGLLGAVARECALVEPARMRLPDGVRPGFLASVSEVVDLTVAAARARRPLDAGRYAAAYVYNGRLYDLRVRRLARHQARRIGARTYADVLEAEFEAANRSTGRSTRFALEYGAAGPLAGVPLRIRYQPRWWLQAELVLDDTFEF